MSEADVQAKMREEWNERAREDAHYYVAFGKREQDDAGFFATASEVVRWLEAELKRLGPGRHRALEIGCGPGRLMLPMSRHFTEIHGIDVSDEMIRRAEINLRGVPQAHVRAANGADLTGYPSEYFDFVYSYAVFQHIPSRGVVYSYLTEIARVLKPGSIACFQVNGLRETSGEYTTWSGVRISAAQLSQLAGELGMRVLALRGDESQYLWTTWRKPGALTGCRMREIRNALTPEAFVPANGRMACCSVIIENLPADCDLNSLEARFDGVPGTGCYVGEIAPGLSQYNVFLPFPQRTGMVEVSLSWNGKPLCPNAWVRVVPPGPAIPRIVSLTDSTNLLADHRVETETVRIHLEECARGDQFSATLDGQSVREISASLADPRDLRYEITFQLPEGTGAGRHELAISLGGRRMPVEIIDVVRSS